MFNVVGVFALSKHTNNGVNMLSIEPNDEECDARDDDSSTEAGLILTEATSLWIITPLFRAGERQSFLWALALFYYFMAKASLMFDKLSVLKDGVSEKLAVISLRGFLRFARKYVPSPPRKSEV